MPSELSSTQLKLQTAQISWRNGAPFSEDFGDIYFNPDAGIGESLAVFIEPTQMAIRLPLHEAQEFSIIETGFGAGVNFLLAAATFAQHARIDTWLNYTAIEAYPLRHDDLQQIHQQLNWADRALLAHLLLHFPPAVQGVYRLCWPHQRIRLTLWWMDVHQALPQIHQQADAWFLDGFAPAKNPGMWSTDMYAQVARCSKPQARFATFTSAGQVRQGLQQAGFVVQKVKGFGHKRHRLEGYWPGESSANALPSDVQPVFKRSAFASSHEVTVIGSGISGCVTARAFAEQGYRVRVLESAHSIAAGASGNSQAALFTQLSIHNSAYNQFQHAAYGFARQVIRPAHSPWSGLHSSGLVHLPMQTRDIRRQQQLAEANLWPEHWMRAVTASEASELAGVPIDQDGIFYPLSARIHPLQLCQHLLAHPLIERQTGQQVLQLEWQAPGWRLVCADHTEETRLLILCTAHHTAKLLSGCLLPLRTLRGQITEMPENSLSQTLRCIVSGQTYLMPSWQGYHLLGATYDHHDQHNDVRDIDHLRNLAGIESWSTVLQKSFNHTPSAWRGRAALRCQTPDYLPLIGPLSAHNQTYPDLLLHCGQGSRGFTQAWLGAEILLGYAGNQGFPVSEAARLAVHPDRFQWRQVRRLSGNKFSSAKPSATGVGACTD